MGGASNLLAQILALAVAGTVIAGIVAAIRGRSSCAIEIRDGEAHIRKGKVPHRLLGEIASVLEGREPFRGTIRVSPGPGRGSLRFSRGFPEDLEQRIRNVWSIHMKR